MSEAEHPERLREGRAVTVDDIRQLMGASTPHFALQLRERIRALIRELPPENPARIEGEREIARLDKLAFDGEVRGHPAEGSSEASAAGPPCVPPTRRTEGRRGR